MGMGVGGDKLHLMSFHIHIPHLHFHHQHQHQHEQQHEKKVEEGRDIPKGCFAIMVGQGEEQQQRFVIPVMYVNHPLFVELLKVAEEEYGFDHKGLITIPCHVEQFRTVRGIIDGDNSMHHHHHHLPISCFRASSH